MLTSLFRSLAPRSVSAAPLLLAALALLPARVRAEGGMVRPDLARPPALVLLWERPALGGVQAIGVYGVTPDAAQPGLVRVKVWDETPNKVLVRNETIRCSPAMPMRVTTDGKRLFVRSLNPGGPINPSNRIDHLVWWASCHPEQAGKDPATLGSLARQLGYSGRLPESEQVLPGGVTGGR